MRAAAIRGQTIYLGPNVRTLDVFLGRNMIFRDGIHPSFHGAIEACPAIGDLIVPIQQCGEVKRQLNHDLAGNMRGTSGRYVALYREVQNWMKKQAAAKQKTSTGVTIKHHA